MKLRLEESGLHYFDRQSGFHLLLDEIRIKESDYTIAPRTLSIAITDDCNSSCPFCHVTKGQNYLTKEFIVDISKKFDSLGTFDIALGGGEPLLHPNIIEICKIIWDETELGISITSNGKLLSDSLIDALAGNVSFFRVSLDTTKKNRYSKLRGFPFESIRSNLEKLKRKIPFGINMVVTKETIEELDEMLNFVSTSGAQELLLLPYIENGEIALDTESLSKMEDWICKNYCKFPVRILEQARHLLDIPVLFEDNRYYNDYLYLSSEGKLKHSSYHHSGIEIEDNNLENLLKDWKSGVLKFID